MEMPDPTKNIILAVVAVVGMLFGAIGFTYGVATRGVVQFVDIQREVLQRVTVLETSYLGIIRSLTRIEQAVVEHGKDNP